MINILDDLNTARQDQLLFLQKTIETVNSALTNQPINTMELQKIIFAISLEELNPDEVRGSRENLIKFLEEGDEAIKYLMVKLNDYQTRYLAASFLGWFGDSASIAIPKLIGLASGHSSAAGAAQKAILFIGGAEEKILQAIREALDSEDDESFRQLSALALRTHLNSSDVFWEVLRKGAVHKNPHIREAVADIVWQLKISDTEQIRSILLSLSIDENQAVRDAALSALDFL